MRRETSDDSATVTDVVSSMLTTGKSVKLSDGAAIEEAPTRALKKHTPNIARLAVPAKCCVSSKLNFVPTLARPPIPPLPHALKTC